LRKSPFRATKWLIPHRGKARMGCPKSPFRVAKKRWPTVGNIAAGMQEKTKKCLFRVFYFAVIYVSITFAA